MPDLPPMPHDPAAYGRAWAAVYDLLEGPTANRVALGPAEVAQRLVAAGMPARGAQVLEFGAGTGRLAVPLADDHDVTATDASPQMLALLRGKDPSGRVHTEVLQMAQPLPGHLAGRFDAVLFAFSTLLWNLSSQDVAASLRNAREALRPGGLVLVEVLGDPDDFAGLGPWQGSGTVGELALRNRGRFDEHTGHVVAQVSADDGPWMAVHVRPVTAHEVEREALAADLAVAQLDQQQLVLPSGRTQTRRVWLLRRPAH